MEKAKHESTDERRRIRKMLRALSMIAGSIEAHGTCSRELETAIMAAGKAAYVHLQRETARVFPDDPFTLVSRNAP